MKRKKKSLREMPGATGVFSRNDVRPHLTIVAFKKNYRIASFKWKFSRPMMPLLLIASDVMIPTVQIHVEREREKRLGSKSINKCVLR